MGKKLREQMTKERSRKKNIKFITITGVIVIIAALIIIAALLLPNDDGNKSISSSETEALQAQVQLSENGDLRIEKALAREDVTFVDYGANQEMLLWLDSDGTYRVAFNTCEECYARNGHYEHEDGVLACSACGNKLVLSSLQHQVWGGCQPIEFPDSGREDTDTEIVILSEAFEYADEMFTAWDDGNTEITFEEFN